MVSFYPARFRLAKTLPGNVRAHQGLVQRQRGRMVSPCPVRFGLMGMPLEYGLRGLFIQATAEFRLGRTVLVCTHQPLMPLMFHCWVIRFI